MRIHDNVSELIGNTPLVSLRRFAPDAKARIAAKLEMFNPMSLKDRPVRAMIEGAEEQRRLRPGGVIVEASSGNTGLAVAMIGRLKGYRVIICMSEGMSLERRHLLRMLGAEVVLTPREEATRGARRKAQEIAAQTPGALYLEQHANPNNPRAHEETTAEELWSDTEGTLDVVVAGLGTGGTLCGIARRLKPRRPSLEIIGVEPAEAPMISQGLFRPHRIMGTSPGFVPPILAHENLTGIELVSEEEAFASCRRLARTEGILAGISSGAVATVCRRLALEESRQGQLIVGIFADTGERYLSVKGLFEETDRDKGSKP